MIELRSDSPLRIRSYASPCLAVGLHPVEKNHMVEPRREYGISVLGDMQHLEPVSDALVDKNPLEFGKGPI